MFSRECRESIEAAFTKLHEMYGHEEFHFRDDHPTRKLAAIQIMAKLDFSFHIISCDKAKLHQDGWPLPVQNQKKPLLSVMAAALIGKLEIPTDIKRLDVLFDNIGGPKVNLEFKKYLKSLLRIKVGPSLPMGICAKDSASSPCVQLADYVCGAYTRSVREDRKCDAEYYEWFKKKELSTSMWP